MAKCSALMGNRDFRAPGAYVCSRYPGLVLRHLERERERGGQKKGPNAHPIDGVGPSKFHKRGRINQGKAPSKGCAFKLAPQRHLLLVDRRGLMSVCMSRRPRRECGLGAMTTWPLLFNVLATTLTPK